MENEEQNYNLCRPLPLLQNVLAFEMYQDRLFITSFTRPFQSIRREQDGDDDMIGIRLSSHQP